MFEGRPEGPPYGHAAPDFTLTDLDGATQSLESLRARGRPVVLEFVDPTCSACDRLLPALARWQASLADRVTVAVVTPGSARSRPEWEEHGITDVLVDESDKVSEAYRIIGTPTAIAVTVDGTVSSGPVGGSQMPEVLIRQILRGEAAVSDDGFGEPASRVLSSEAGTT